MPFPFDKYPWVNFHELNLAYFIEHFQEIFSQWNELYNGMVEWKADTEEDLETWKTGVMDAIDTWEHDFSAEIQVWQQETETDLANWKTATLAALDAWKTAAEATFEAIRVQASGSASAAAQSAADAETAQAAAAAAQAAAETAAASVASSAALIAKNAADISGIKGNIDTIIGSAHDITETTNITGTDIMGATAAYSGGKINLSGTASAQRVLLCLNGQNAVKTTTGVFIQTAPAGRYIAHLKVSGTASDHDFHLRYTKTTFSVGNYVEVSDGDTIDADAGIMVGLFVPYGVNFGSTSDPTAFDIALTPVPEKMDASEISHLEVLGYSNAVAIPSGADFNDYNQDGNFYVPNSTVSGSALNIPVNAVGRLTVKHLYNSARFIQKYVTSSGNIFIRRYTTAYAKWEQVMTSAEIKSSWIQYTTGSWSGATERIGIFLPATTGYIYFRMYHFVTDNNADLWRIASAAYISDQFTNTVDFTVDGEWECAVKLQGRDDFSGGSTHGDEKMVNDNGIPTDLIVLLDGKPVDKTTLTSMTQFKTLKIIRASILFDPSDHTTKIADHGVEYSFDNNGLTINQALEWRVNAQLDNCFLGMFTPSKDYIDRAAGNSDFKTVALASTASQGQSTVVMPDASAIELWDTASGVSACLEAPIYPSAAAEGLANGDRITIGDNGGLGYNKVYFWVCGSGNITAGKLWKSSVKYKINHQA